MMTRMLYFSLVYNLQDPLKSRRLGLVMGFWLILNEAVITNFVIKSYPTDYNLMETLFIQTTVALKTIIIGATYKHSNMDLSSFHTVFGNRLGALALERNLVIF